MAAALGDRYLFAFVVLNSVNDYERPFAVLLSLEEVEARTRSKRVQFQVNFRSDIQPADVRDVIVFQPEGCRCRGRLWSSPANLPELFQLPLGVDKLTLVADQVRKLAIDSLADASAVRPGPLEWSCG